MCPLACAAYFRTGKLISKRHSAPVWLYCCLSLCVTRRCVNWTVATWRLSCEHVGNADENLKKTKTFLTPDSTFTVIMSGRNNNKLPTNLPQLQNLIKRDPQSYTEEVNCVFINLSFSLQWQNYGARRVIKNIQFQNVLKILFIVIF